MPIAIKHTKHYVIAPHAMYGHVSPATGLACNLVTKFDNLLITLLIPTAFSTCAKTRIDSFQLRPTETSRLRIIHVGGPSEPKLASPFTKMDTVEELIGPALSSIADVYTSLLKCEAVEDVLTGEKIDSWSLAPSVAIVDITIAASAIKLLPKLNLIHRKDVKMLCFAPLSAQWASWSEVQETDGGYEGYMQRGRKILDADSDETRTKAYKELIEESHDLLNVPGCASVYAYETCPNQADGYVEIMTPVMETLHLWDGLVNIWPTCLGREFQKYNDYIGLPCMQVGPQYPSSQEIRANFGTSPQDLTTQTFLDKALFERGEKSVLYIGFGTLFYSPNATQMRVMLQVLRELDMPFILGSGGASPDVKAICEDFVSKGINGVISDWVPQAAVLAHPATGWFLTHGGSNSTLEAIRLKIPLVFWPAAYDQVWTANAFSNTFKIGVELLQVRNGYNIGRETAGGVLVEGTEEAMFKEFREIFSGLKGALGRELRANVESMGDEMVVDVEEGDSHRALARLASL